ncbi:MAG: autotransporter outer membrane beta-barrel domain-containing protein [Opitutaceae bacterium]|jgi:hypothetical protein
MKHLALLALLATPVALLHAQTEQTIIDRSQQPAPPPAQPAAQAGVTVAPGDADAGNQRIAEPRKLPVKFTFAYDAQFYSVNNVNLAPSGTAKEDALILSNALSVSAEFHSMAVGPGVLTPSIGLSFQRFNHGIGNGNTYNDLDFDSYSIPLSLRYRFGANWDATLGVNTNAVYSLDGSAAGYHEIFRSYSPSLGLHKLISLSQNQILSLGTGLSYAYTKSDRDSVPAGFTPFRDDRNDKWDASLDAAYYYLHGQWTVGPYARIGYSYYLHYQESALLPPAVNVDRQDLTFSVGLSVTYAITPWASARVFTSFEDRESLGDSAFDYGYSNTNAGLGLTLSASY